MHSDEFEKGFDNFIDGQEYEATEQMIFALVRAAFAAGWSAAGGSEIVSGKTVFLMK